MKTSVTCLAVAAAAAFAASAVFGAVPPAALAKIAEHLPLAFHAMPAKPRAAKAYPLVSERKRVYVKKLSVNVAKDELVLLAISDDRKVVQLAYPLGERGGDYLTGWFWMEDVLDFSRVKMQPPAEYRPPDGVRCLLYRANGYAKPALVGCMRVEEDAWALGERRVRKAQRGRDEYVFRLLCLGMRSYSLGEHAVAARLVFAREERPFGEAENELYYHERVQDMIGEDPYQPGRHWDNSTHPLLVRSGNGGCAAFVTDFAKYLFDARNFNAGVRFDDASEIRAGDVIALEGHFISVIDRYPDGTLHTMDGNCNCSIRRTKRAYSIVDGKLRGGKFRHGWHYLSKPLDPPDAGKRRKRR
jgi:hypothetical protein